jgi:hypothetical protein
MQYTLSIKGINKKINGSDFKMEALKISGIPSYETANPKDRDLLNKLIKKALRLELQNYLVSKAFYLIKDGKPFIILKDGNALQQFDFSKVQKFCRREQISWSELVSIIPVEKPLESKRFNQMVGDLHKWTGKPLEELQKLTVEELGEKHEKAETLIAELMREQMAKLDI